MATPSLAMIPSAYADSKVYSVLPNNGDGDFTFNRDSSATRVGQNGLIQTVGYFGSELVTNGDFATDTDWTKETGWTISGGTANFSGGTGNKAIYQAAGITNGKTYKIQYQVSSISAGQVAVRLGGMAGVDEITATTIGNYTGYITATGSANGNIHIEDNDNNFIGSIDNVSVKEVLGDQPRLNYDISNGVVQSCPSLLLEPSSTNLVPYSSDFTDSSWTTLGVGTGTNPIVTSNYAISPDGTQNADRIQFNLNGGTTTTDRSFIRYQSLSSQTNYYYSCYVKSANNQTQKLLWQHGGDDNEFTITTEWQRFELDLNGSAETNAGLSLRGAISSVDSADVLVWGFQVEQNSYATSYIPTSGASQTRAAETCNGAGTASTFNSTEGVLYAEIAGLSNPVDSPKNITISDGTVSKYVRIEYYQDGKVYGNVYDGASVAASFVVNQTNFNKIAIQYSSSGSKLYVNGTGVNFASKIFASNTLNTIQFSSAAANSNYFYGKVKDIRVYNEALTDAQLQTLTTL